MKTIMISPQNKKRANPKIYISAVFWLALAVLIFFSGSRAFLKNVVAKTALILIPERAALEASRQNLVTALELRNLKVENAKLKTALNLKSKNKIIPARIKFGGGYIFSDVFFIDEGANANIKPGDFIISLNNVFLGKVIETGSNWSKAASPGRWGEKILLKKNVVFEAIGLGAGELKAELPLGINLKAGDELYWGEEPAYIAGLVDKIIAGESGEPEKAIILNPVSINKTSDVLVVLKK